jgi:hypothetical protein
MKDVSNPKKNIVKMQLPISAELKAKGEKLAEEAGLSSFQELLRFWTKQAAEGNLSVVIDPAITPEKAMEYEMMAREAYKEYKAGKLKGYSNAKDLIAALEKDMDELED